MNNIAVLEYTFMFNPTEAWTNGLRFEADLADFFAAHGYEASLVNTQGNSGKRIIYIAKIQEAIPKLENTPPPPTHQQARETMRKQFQMRDINFQGKGGNKA